MTEKQYGGSTSHGFKGIDTKNAGITKHASSQSVKLSDNSNRNDLNSLSKETLEKYKKAGKIASEAVKFARSLVKKDTPLLEIAEKIENKIIELGGKPAFPVNLSINEVAAHSTPSFNSTDKASGLIKVDLGVHIDGYVADTSFSLDLESLEENKKLIQTAEKALEEACKIVHSGIKIKEIGKSIENTIRTAGLQPIHNLSGHSIEQYNLHAGTTIPNIDNAQEKILLEGVYAVEPFVTSGLGSVRDGKPSGIYMLTKQGQVRDMFARQVLAWIQEEYQTLPFCLRWLVKKFGTRAVIAMQRIEEAGLVHHYPQLIESGKGKVAQAEHTLIVTDKEVVVTTK